MDHRTSTRQPGPGADAFSPTQRTDTFAFTCDPSCWGTCCRQVEIVLYPSDVLRLARRFARSMHQVIQEHCQTVIAAVTGMPAVCLRDAQYGPCEFLLADGRCSVYADRPAVCRSSPIFTQYAYEDGTVGAAGCYHLLPHQDCQKKNTTLPSREWTVLEWIDCNELQATWQDHEWCAGLTYWASHELGFSEWATPDLMTRLFKILYGFDDFTPAELPDQERFRRWVEAARWFLGRAADALRGVPPEAADRVRQSSFTGHLWREALEILWTGSRSPAP